MSAPYDRFSPESPLDRKLRGKTAAEMDAILNAENEEYIWQARDADWHGDDKCSDVEGEA